MRQAGAVVMLVTASSAAEAEKIARPLVEEALAACVNIVAPIRSIYRWQGRLCDEPEALLVIKTTARRIEAVRERVTALHSYSVPEVIALPITAGSEPYLKWVDESTK